MNHITKGIIVTILLALALSCTDKTRYRVYLDDAAETMETNTERSLSLLGFLEESMDELPESERMRYFVLLADAKNKSYQQMPSDTIFKEVVNYYDNHGDANEKMKAHYLLGCIYRDMNDCPTALRCYLDATEMADTLDESCDYLTLMSVYGQMADIYHMQTMPDEEIEARKHYSKWAFRQNNIREAILGLQLQTEAYFTYKDTAKVLEIVDSVYKLYKDNGFIKEAARSLSPAIYIHIARKNLKLAKAYMTEFETKAGLYDESGNISKNYEGYCIAKAEYYEAQGITDSASFYYHKALGYGYRHDAYCGLFNMYTRIGNADSIRHYAPIYIEMLNRRQNELRAVGMQQTAALYQYSRHERIAQQKTIEALESRNKLYIACVLAIILGLMAYTTYHLFMKKQKRKNELLAAQLNQEVQKNRKTQNQLSSVKSEYDDAQIKINSLEEDIDMLKLKLNDLQVDTSVFFNSDIYHTFMQFAGNYNTDSCPSKEQWSELISNAKKYLPIMYTRMLESRLSAIEMHICILTRMGLESGEICRIMNRTSQQVSNTKIIINRKIFGDPHASTLTKNLKGIAENKEP